MSLYPDEIRRKVVANNGYDPDKYDMDDSGNIVTRQAPVSPTTGVGTEQIDPKPKYTKTQTAFQHGLENLVPGVAAGLTGLAFISRFGGPWGLAASVPLTIGAAALTKLGQEKAQQAVMGEEDFQARQQMLAESAQENPWSAIIGSAAPQVLTARPNLGTSVNALKGAGNLAERLVTRPVVPTISNLSDDILKSIPLAQRQAMLATGAGAGIGAGLDVAQQMVQNRSIDPTQLDPRSILASTILGGLLTEPTRLGRSVMKPQATPFELQTKTVKPTETAVPPKPTEEFTAPPIEEAQRIIAEKNIDKRKLYGEVFKEFADRNKAKELTGEKPYTREELKKFVSAETNRRYQEAIKAPKPVEVPAQTKEEADFAAPKFMAEQAEKPAEPVVKPIEPAKPPTADQRLTEERQKAGYVPPRELEEDVMMRAGARSVTYDPSLPQLGKQDVRDITINPVKRDPTTGFHEAAHQMTQFIEEAGSQTMKAALEKGRSLLNEGKRVFGKVVTPQDVAARNGRQVPNAQDIATAAEENTINTIAQRATNLAYLRERANWVRRTQKWVKDYVSLIKTKTGSANADDIANFLARRELDLPNYWETGEAFKDLKAIVSPAKMSDEPLEASAAPEKPLAPVEYKGFQPGFEDLPGIHLYNLTEDIPGTQFVKGSTVSKGSLEKAGFKVPEPPAKFQEQAVEPEYFKESKVRDETGKLIPMYHGTQRAGFSVFHPESHFGTKEQAENLLSTKASIRKKYIHKWENLTDQDILENSYEFGKSDAVYPVYLNIKNPKRVSDQGKNWEAAIAKAKQEGYDGLVYSNTEEGPGDSYLAFYPEQIKSIWNKNPTDSPDIRYQDQPVESPTPVSSVATPDEKVWASDRRSLFKILTPRHDKLLDEAAKTNDPAIQKTANEVVKQTHLFEGYKSMHAAAIEGAFMTRIVKQFKKPEIEKVYRYRYEMDDTGSSDINLTTREQKLNDIWQQIIEEPRDKQNALGLKVREGERFRVGGIKPEGYLPNIASIEFVDAIKSGKNVAGFRKLYVDHAMSKGASEAEANEAFDTYRKAVGHAGTTQETDYAALRKAEGIGLPWELIEKNPAMAMSRYANRAGADLAFFEAFENNARMRKALGLRDQFGKQLTKEELDAMPDVVTDVQFMPAWQESKRSIMGFNRDMNPLWTAANRLVGNVFMGPGTATRNQLAAFVNNGPFTINPFDFIRAAAKMNERAQRAWEKGAVKASFSDLDAAGVIENHPNRIIDLMNKVSAALRKWQGREFSDYTEGLFQYSMGEEMAIKWFAAAKDGSIEAKRNLRKLGDLVENLDEKLKPGGQVTQEDISRVAKRYVDHTRGTYGPEGLPSWAEEGVFAPYVQLQRFGVEKANRFYQDVIDPARQGDLKPLLRVTLGGLASGLLIEKFNELISGRRGADPTVKETIEFGDKEDAVYKALAIAQLTSYGGILSDFAKFGAKITRGETGKYNEPLSMPLLSFAESAYQNAAGLFQSIRDGDDFFQAALTAASELVKANAQTVRYAQQFIDPESTTRKERFRDRRIFDTMVEGEAPPPIVASNELVDKDLKTFKRTGSIEEAQNLLPKLLEDAVAKSKNASGALDPEKLKKQLKKIKQNSYQTMPNPETMPGQFYRYLEFLSRTQGAEAAQATLENYIMQNQVNRAKSAMVP